MDLDKGLIKDVAKNAKLELTKEEIDEFLPQLKEIFETFSAINEVDTKGDEMSIQPVKIRNALREDEIGECLLQEDALKNSNHTKDGYFKGPKAV